MESKALTRILLVDDDVFIIRLLTLLLRKSKYDILSATDGQDAIRLLSEQSVDMIIADLMMPKMDGITFLHWLRQEAKATLPVLILTGMATQDAEEQALAAGATAILYKPIKINELLEKIQQLEQLL
jgi:CheY-like chemotaxis protein